MQEGGRKVKATGSSRFRNILWNKIDLDRTSYHIDGLIHSVFLESLNLCHFYDSDAQIQTIIYYFTEVYRLNSFAGNLRYLITLLKYTLFYYLVERITNKITLLSFTQP